jgi:hypothetical protein
MRSNLTKLRAPAALALLLCANAARADDTSFSDVLAKKLSYGVGIRTGFGTTFASGSDATLGVNTLDVRPYISGQIFPWLKFTGNLDLNGGDGQNIFSHIDVLDAIAQIEPSELFNIWMGRFLPPTDRANLSGPYYQNDWYYPGQSNGYPSIYAGRADGAAVWGQVKGGQFKYQLGVFETASGTTFAHSIYAARLTFNFLDPEPGYYNSSTYYGTKNVLALGGVIQYEKLPDTVASTDNKLVAFNFDLLFEKPMAPGTISLEGAYYNFDQGSGSGKQGSSFWVLAGFLVAQKAGPGRIQPVARVQDFMPTGGGSSTVTIDGGLNYILDAHNARMALVFQNVNPPGAPATTNVQFGIQFQE